MIYVKFCQTNDPIFLGIHSYIVSDCDSIKTMVVDQKFLDETVYEGAAHAMRAGTVLFARSIYIR